MNDTLPPASLPPTVFAELRNVDPFYRKDLRKRNGRQRVLTTTLTPSDKTAAVVTSMVPYDIEYGGTRYSGLVLSDGRYLWCLYHSGSAVTQTANLYDAGSGNSGSRWRGFNHKGVCYLTNAAHAVLALRVTAGPVFNIIESGVRTPTTAQATSFGTPGEINSWSVSGTARYTAGQIVYIRVSFYNANAAVEGNPSAVSTDADSIGTWKVTVQAAEDDIRIPVPARSTLGLTETNGEDWYVRIYVSPAASAAYASTDLYLDGEVDLHATNVTNYYLGSSGVSDDEAMSRTSESIWTWPGDEDGNPRIERDTPPICKCMAFYANRGWYGGAGTAVSPHGALPRNYIAFSEYDTPENVAYTDQQSQHWNGTHVPTRGDVNALTYAADRLIVLSANDAFSVWGSEPKFSLSEAITGHGCTGPDAAGCGSDAAFYLSRDGVYAFVSASIQSITHDVLDTAYAALDSDGLAYGVVVYYPEKRQVWCFARSSGATVQDTALVYQLGPEGGGWVVMDGIWATIASTARNVHENTSTEYLYALHSFTDGDALACSILYLMDAGDNDGGLDVAGAMDGGTRTGTVTSASSTTITDSGASFYNTGAKLKGAALWVTDANGGNAQLRYITTNNGTQLTVNAAWDTNPSAGWLYHVGGIHQKIVTPAMTALGDGWLYVVVSGVQMEIDRMSYTDDAVVYVYPLIDRASSIVTGETKATANIGNATIGDWPVAAFTSGLTTRAGEAQVVIESYQGDRPVRIRKIAVPYEILPMRR